MRSLDFGTGYYAIDHNTGELVGRAWRSWNELAMELLRRGLAIPVDDTIKPRGGRIVKPSNWGQP